MVRLTTHSDLAFRTLIFLGTAHERGATIPQIGAAFGVSEHHLRKVVGELSRLKLVKTTRGRGGGLRLAEGAGDQTIGALLRQFEPDFAAQECLGAARKGCVIFGCCGLRGVFNEAQRGLFAVLDTYKLADVLKRSPGVPAALGLPPAA